MVFSRILLKVAMSAPKLMFTSCFFYTFHIIVYSDSENCSVAMTQMNQYSLESVMAMAWEQEDTVISLVEEGNLFKFLLRSTLVLSTNVLNYNTNQFQQKQ